MEVSYPGNRLKLTQKSYDDAINKLSEGKGNLIRGAQLIEKLPDNFESGAWD